MPSSFVSRISGLATVSSSMMRLRASHFPQGPSCISDTQLSNRGCRMGGDLGSSLVIDRPSTVRRTYRFRIYPTRSQLLALEAQPGFACDLYNAALEQRRYAWRCRRRSVYLYDQFRELTDVRAASLGPIHM